MFRPGVWNVHTATRNGEPRTNNVSEGWNNKLGHLVGHNHPSIWRAINAIQKDEAMVSIVVQQQALGARRRPTRRRAFVQLQERLRNLYEEIHTDDRTLPNFIRAVARNIRHTPANIPAN